MTSRVSIRAVAGPGGTVIASLSGTEPWRPRVLGGVASATAGWARVALVQSRASLLEADDVALEVDVQAGAALELVEIGAMLAHSARHGREASVTARARVEDGGRLIWLGQPLIIGAGAAVRSELAIELAAGALMLRGESVVLGRAGEECGSLCAHTRVTHDSSVLLDETLETGDRVVLRSPVIAGEARMIAAVTLGGCRDHLPPADVMQAHGPATLWRGAGDTVVLGRSAERVAGRWRRLIGDRVPFAGDVPVGVASSSHRDR